MVLQNIGDDRRAFLTSPRHEDVLGGVGRRGRVHEGSLREHRLHRRLLELLIRAILRAIQLWLLVYRKARS